MKLFETMDDVERHMVRLQLSETSMPSSDATNVYWSKYDNLIQVINKTSELSSGAYNEIFMEDNATVNFIFKCHLYDFIYLQISSIKKYKNSKDPGLTIDEIFSPTGSGVKEINQYLKELPLSAFEEWIDIKEGKDRNHLLTINSGKQKKHYTYE
uniref:Uncharacterized protein n=1 Tax=Rhabditophanes sp. KR3021 TaxID=114890 RepID=A0AC35TR55_9BILA